MTAEISTAELPHEIALRKAKIQLMARPDSAFFTTLCFSLIHLFSDTVSTAATNGRTVWYNIKFFMDLDIEEQLFLILHETLHCAFLHMVRIGSRCPDRWNIAADHVINLLLIERGFKMPKGGLADPQYKGMSVEEVYNLLPDNPGKPMMSDLIPSDGADTEEALQKDMEDILVRAQIQSVASGDKAGTIPGDIEVFLNKLLNPKLPWNRILQKYLQSFAKNDYSWKRFNRRFNPVLLPGLYSINMMDLAVATDISGSVSDKDFLQIVTESHSILRMMKPEKMTLIQFDTAIKSVDELRSIRDLMNVKFKGRGGTDVTPVLEWAKAKRPQLLLIFTDGYFTMPDMTVSMPVIWLIHNNPQFTAPFGKVIHYSMEN